MYVRVWVRAKGERLHAKMALSHASRFEKNEQCKEYASVQRLLSDLDAKQSIPLLTDDTITLQERLLKQKEFISALHEEKDVECSSPVSEQKEKEYKTTDATSSSLETWLDEFLTSNPDARKNLDGTRALIRVSELSASKWPSTLPKRGYNNTKYSNDYSSSRQEMAPKKVLPSKYFLTPMFAGKSDHHMFSRALKKKYDPSNGRLLRKKKVSSHNSVESAMRGGGKIKKRKEVSFSALPDFEIDKAILKIKSSASGRLYPSTSETSDMHTVAPTLSSLPPMLPPQQFLDPTIKLNEPVHVQADILAVLDMQATKAMGGQKKPINKRVEKTSANERVLLTVRCKQCLLLVNVFRVSKKKQTVLETFHASRSRQCRYVFPEKLSIIQALHKTGEAYPEHIKLALSWTVTALPVSMHGATVFAAFSALVHGKQMLPPPLVLNRYASFRQHLESSTVSTEAAYSSPLLEYLNLIDPRRNKLEPLACVKTFPQRTTGRPSTAPGGLGHMPGISVASSLDDEADATSMESQNMAREQHGSTGGTYSASPGEEHKKEIPYRENASLTKSVKDTTEELQVLRLMDVHKETSTKDISTGEHMFAYASEHNAGELTLGPIMSVPSSGISDETVNSSDLFVSKGVYKTLVQKPVEREILLKTAMKLPDFYDPNCSDFRDFSYHFVEVVEVEHELIVTAIRASSGAVIQKRVSGQVLALILSRHAASKMGSVLPLTSLDPHVSTVCSSVLRCLATVKGEALLFRDYSKLA